MSAIGAEPEVVIYADHEQGRILMIYRNVPIAEYEGNIVPAVKLTPKAARDIGVCLLKEAERIEPEG